MSCLLFQTVAKETANAKTRNTSPHPCLMAEYCCTGPHKRKSNRFLVDFAGSRVPSKIIFCAGLSSCTSMHYLETSTEALTATVRSLPWVAGGEGRSLLLRGNCSAASASKDAQGSKKLPSCGGSAPYDSCWTGFRQYAIGIPSWQSPAACNEKPWPQPPIHHATSDAHKKISMGQL